ncbi:Poly(A) polymerase pla1 [Fusarium oxysporum f. sp. albedinis]|nr:Poly(A) polymerase pla1 [Fusarium oxysporum f. sp. albedinis]
MLSMASFFVLYHFFCFPSLMWHEKPGLSYHNSQSQYHPPYSRGRYQSYGYGSCHVQKGANLLLRTNYITMTVRIPSKSRPGVIMARGRGCDAWKRGV